MSREKIASRQVDFFYFHGPFSGPQNFLTHTTRMRAILFQVIRCSVSENSRFAGLSTRTFFKKPVLVRNAHKMKNSVPLQCPPTPFFTTQSAFSWETTFGGCRNDPFLTTKHAFMWKTTLRAPRGESNSKMSRFWTPKFPESSVANPIHSILGNSLLSFRKFSVCGSPHA